MQCNLLWKSIKFLLLMTVLCGALYTGIVTAAAQIFFPSQANGSILEINGKKYGCELLGQQYTDQAHLWGRIMKLDLSTFVDSDGRRLMYAVPSNLSPAGAEFEALVAARVDLLRQANPEMENAAIPVDLVTCSGSGLDPHISPAAALYQVPRLAAANQMTEAEVVAVLTRCTEGKLWGLFGEPAVNVLRVNLMLDGIL